MTIQQGNLMTIEAAIYFIPFALELALNTPEQKIYLNEEKLKEYEDFGGVRIEDCIFINENGIENFQGTLPRTTEKIEEFMAKNNIHLRK